MKKITLQLLIVLSFLNLKAQTIGTFVQENSLGNDLVSRHSAGMVAINNQLYILGGNTSANAQDFASYDLENNSLTKLPLIEEGPTNPKGISTFAVGSFIYHFDAYGSGINKFDTATNEWTYIGPMAPLTPSCGFVIGTKIYIFSSQTGSNGFYAFDTMNNTWEQKANYPGPSGKRGAVAFEIDGKGYFGTGRFYQTELCNLSDGGCYTSDFFEYDPVTDVWVSKASLPIPFAYGVGISVGDKGYVGLGEASSGTFGGLNFRKWYQYDPVTDQWIAKQNFMNVSDTELIYFITLNASSYTKIGTDIYLFGGNIGRYGGGGRQTDSLYKYDTLLDTWTLIDDELGSNRTIASGFYSNGKIYAGGGQNSEVLNDFWEYDIATSTWTEKASLENMYYSRGVAEVNGKGYFIGGYNPIFSNFNQSAITYSNKLLEYDPITDTWIEKAPYPGGARSEMLVMSHNGKLYAGMGFNGNSSASLNQFYEYDPVTNIWTQLSSPPIDVQTRISYFIIGETAYVFRMNYTGSFPLMKYSFATNTWTAEALTSQMNLEMNNFTNVAFSYGGKGYIVRKRTTDNISYHNLAEFDPVTNTFTDVAKIPFYSYDQSIISTPEGIYFAFGARNFYVNGTTSSNGLWKLKLDPEISTQAGLFESIENADYPSCSTGQLPANSHFVVADNDGAILAKVSASSEGQAAVCVKASSIANNPYSELIHDFGNGTETASFMNKNVLIDNGGVLYGGASLSIYFTEDELNNFVEDFNVQYQEDKTIADIKFWSYYENSNAIDTDPLNNTSPQGYHLIFDTTLGEYGAGKFLEATSTTSSTLKGEIYPVLFTQNDLKTPSIEASKISVYPNPTKDFFTIDIQENHTGYIELFDVLGKKVHSDDILNKKMVIDVTNLTRGIYFLNIHINETRSVVKIIKN